MGDVYSKDSTTSIARLAATQAAIKEIAGKESYIYITLDRETPKAPPFL